MAAKCADSLIQCFLVSTQLLAQSVLPITQPSMSWMLYSLEQVTYIPHCIRSVLNEDSALLWRNMLQGLMSGDEKCSVENTGTITWAVWREKYCLDILIFGCEELTVVPDASFTLNAFCICKRADTGMCAQTLPPMTHPGFTEITDCTLQLQREILSCLERPTP